MKRAWPIALLLVVSCASAPAATREADVRRTVEAFYAAFNSHTFDRAAEFTTEDWNHVNPFGGWTKSREEVLAELHQVHTTFLKGTTDSVESMSVRFVANDVALVTVTSHMSPFTTPDGTRHDDRQRRTFVVVQRGGAWLITSDQNTILRSAP